MNGAHAHEVDEGGPGRLVTQGGCGGELFRSPCREAHERIRPQHRADLGDRRVLLAHVQVDVEALLAQRADDFQSIIDEDGHGTRLARRGTGVGRCVVRTRVFLRTRPVRRDRAASTLQRGNGLPRDPGDLLV